MAAPTSPAEAPSWSEGGLRFSQLFFKAKLVWRAPSGEALHFFEEDPPKKFENRTGSVT